MLVCSTTLLEGAPDFTTNYIQNIQFNSFKHDIIKYTPTTHETTLSHFYFNTTYELYTVFTELCASYTHISVRHTADYCFTVNINASSL